MHNNPVGETLLPNRWINLLNVEMKKSAGGLPVYVNRNLEDYMHILQILMENHKEVVKVLFTGNSFNANYD